MVERNPDSQQRAAVLSSWAKTEDWAARTAKARAARDAKRLEKCGGDARRAEAARKAEFIEMGRKSGALRRAAAKARREAATEAAKQARREAAAQAAAEAAAEAAERARAARQAARQAAAKPPPAVRLLPKPRGTAAPHEPPKKSPPDGQSGGAYAVC